MPEIGAMMRAIELQRLVENKVTEWRERSARVMSAGAGAGGGGGMAASYQSSNFRRYTNHRKNSAEIKRIIAKYSRRDERPREPSPPPARPPRNKKLKYSHSEDNLAAMDLGQVPRFQPEPPPRFHYTRSKYNAKSCEDLTAFVDVERSNRSKNFEENSIMNARHPQPRDRPNSCAVSEGVYRDSKYDDFDIRDDPKFVTSTPIPHRRNRHDSELLSDSDRKRDKYSELKKGSSEPNILSVSAKTTASTNTLDAKKKWTILKQPFKKGTFDCLVLWKRRKTRVEPTRFQIDYSQRNKKAGRRIVTKRRSDVRMDDEDIEREGEEVCECASACARPCLCAQKRNTKIVAGSFRDSLQDQPLVRFLYDFQGANDLSSHREWQDNSPPTGTCKFRAVISVLPDC
ncbi:hypothetical protein EVAR_64581_1 [Eumeta japonica]|uniref:Uncharacterized protein n=1 Tax=Eumeta variegata TaxID=151549 RepID=A0A4C1ZNI8_EUMVA|nr:hypothetical protein EVAR_64581_1 [Eumeta japonica]